MGRRGPLSQEAALLLGEYERRLDEKNRLTIPARLRDRFADGVFLTRGLDRCLAAYTREGWDAWLAELRPG